MTGSTSVRPRHLSLVTSTTPVSVLSIIDAEQATRHLEVLHAGAGGYASFVLLGNSKRERHCFTDTADLTRLVGRDIGSADLADVVDNHWNVYTACATFTTVPKKGRGTREHVCSVPGVWADLDVKPGVEGYFQSSEQLDAFVTRLPPPTMRVASGSGGQHVYWLATDRLEPMRAQKLLRAWLDYLRAEADGAVIENVMDTARILRLAGTVRWPKQDDTQMREPRPVELVKDSGPRYQVEQLELQSSYAHTEAQATRDSLIEQRTALDNTRREQMRQRGLNPGTYDALVKLFNISEDWERLLSQRGWTLFSDQRTGPAGCRYWVRPGKSAVDGKSASTDFSSELGTSNTMTIYSSDSAVLPLWQNTGTMDAHGICSKFHFAKMELYGGNEEALLRDIARGKGRLP